MKIHETKITNEGPLDLLTTQGRSQRRAFKSGQQTVTLTTQNLMRQFAQFLGTQGLRKYTEASIEDLRSFLNTKNVDTSDISDKNPNQALTKEFVTKYLTIKSREAVTGKRANTNAPAPDAQGQSSPNTDQDQSQFSTRRNKDTTTTQTAPAIDIPKGMSMTASDGKNYVWKGASWVLGNSNRIAKKSVSQELNKKFQSAVQKLPSDIQDTVSKLTPDQKNILKSIL